MAGMSALDMLLGKVELNAPAQGPPASQISGDFGTFQDIFAKLFNSLQLNPQDLSGVSFPVENGANPAGLGEENALFRLFQALFLLPDGESGVDTQAFKDFLGKLGLTVTDQGIFADPNAQNFSQLQAFLQNLGFMVSEQNGQWVVTDQGGTPATFDQLAQALNDKRDTLLNRNDAARQASYSEANLDMPEENGQGTVDGKSGKTAPAPSTSLFVASGFTPNGNSPELKSGATGEGQTSGFTPDGNSPDIKSGAAGEGQVKGDAGRKDPEIERILQEAEKIRSEMERRTEAKGEVKPAPANSRPQAQPAAPPQVEGEKSAAEKGPSISSNVEFFRAIQKEGGSKGADPQQQKLAVETVPLKDGAAVPDSKLTELKLLSILGNGGEQARLDLSATGQDLTSQNSNGQNQNPWAGHQPSILLSQGETQEARGGQPVQHQPQSDLGRDLIQQMVDRARVQLHRNESRIELQLKPEFLGKVRIEIESKQGQLSVSIHTENHAVKHILENNLAALKQNFAELGLRLDSLQVSVDQQDLAQNPNSMSTLADHAGDGRDSESDRESRRQNFSGGADGRSDSDRAFDKLLTDAGRVDLFA